MLFLFEFEFLERDDIPGLRIASAEHNSVRTLLDLVQPLVHEHGTSRHNWGVTRPRRNAHAVELVYGGRRAWSGRLRGLRRGRGAFGIGNL